MARQRREQGVAAAAPFFVLKGRKMNAMFTDISLSIAAIARNGGVVTVTTAGNLPVDVNGLTMNISGVADQSYNGSFLVTSTGANTLTYVEGGANSTSTGGTVSKLTGVCVLYPMGEVLGG